MPDILFSKKFCQQLAHVNGSFVFLVMVFYLGAINDLIDSDPLLFSQEGIKFFLAILVGVAAGWTTRRLCDEFSP